jgi:hypothetical protein
MRLPSGRDLPSVRHGDSGLIWSRMDGRGNVRERLQTKLLDCIRGIKREATESRQEAVAIEGLHIASSRPESFAFAPV